VSETTQQYRDRLTAGPAFDGSLIPTNHRGFRIRDEFISSGRDSMGTITAAVCNPLGGLTTRAGRATSTIPTSTVASSRALRSSSAPPWAFEGAILLALGFGMLGASRYPSRFRARRS